MVRLLSYAGMLKGTLRHVMNATATATDLTSSGRDVIEVLRSRSSLPAKMAYIDLLALNGMDQGDLLMKSLKIKYHRIAEN